MNGQFPNTSEEASYTVLSNPSFSMSIGTGGTITATYKKPARISGKTLTLTPTDLGLDVLKWTCRAENIPQNAIPAECTAPSAQTILQESVMYASLPKTSITEYLLTTELLPNNNEIGYAFPEGMPHTITTGQNGEITISYSSPAALAGGEVTLIPRL